MYQTGMLSNLLLILPLVSTVLCTEATTTVPDLSTAEKTIVNTELEVKVPTAEKIYDKPTVIVEVVDDPTTSDVCRMSLVSISEQNEMKHEKCKCVDLNETVDCKYLHITELPKLISFPKATRSVSFKGNKIENLKQEVFYSGRNVEKLDLSHNRINFISTDALKPFEKLRHLDISHNNIWNMPEKSFQDLTELQYLNLGYNDLVSISPNLFKTTADLRELILESNPLRDLQPKLFEHLPKLEVLHLESTLLKVIPDHIFIFTPHLKVLDLSSNQLTEVPSDALKALDFLKSLDLSGNPITVIPSEAFVGMRGLVNLYLDRMPLLTKIEKFAFGDLQQLHELHSSYNFLLSEIDENAFVRKVDNSKVPLSQLFLRQNALTTIPQNILSWNDEVEFHIESNPLICDCNIQWMITQKLKNDMQTHVR